jgi:hypothetical protein
MTNKIILFSDYLAFSLQIPFAECSSINITVFKLQLSNTINLISLKPTFVNFLLEIWAES